MKNNLKSFNYSLLLENKYDDALKYFLKQDDTRSNLRKIGLDGLKWVNGYGETKIIDVNDAETVKPFLRSSIGIIGDKTYRTYQKAIARLWIDMMLERNPRKEASFEDIMKGILKAVSGTSDDNSDLSGKSMDQLQSEYSKAIKSNTDAILNRIKGKEYDSNTYYKIVEIHNFEEAKAYYKYTSDLNTPWCVTHMEDQFDEYSSCGANRIYFALNAGFKELKKPSNITIDTPYDEYGMSMMFISIAPSGMISNITSRWNHDAGVPDKESKWYGYGNSDRHYFEKDGEYDTDLLSKMFGCNFYDIFKPKSFDEVIKEYTEVNDPGDDCSVYFKYKKGTDKFFIFDKETDKLLYETIYSDVSYENGLLILFDEYKYEYGILDKNGKEVIPFIYDSIDTDEKYNVIIVEKDGKFGGIDKNSHHIVMPFEYDYFDGFNKYGFANVKKDNKIGLINGDGKEVIPCIYNYIDQFDENGIALVSADKKYSYININGGTPVVYDAIYSFNEYEVALAKKDGKYGLINKNNKILAPFEYDLIYDFDEDGFAEVKKDFKYGYINKYGKEVIPCIYDHIDTFNENGIAEVRNDGRHGYINKEGKILIPCEYDNIYIYGFDEDGICEVEKDGKRGYINKEGKEIIPCIYDGFTRFDENGIAAARTNTGWVYLNKLGQKFNTKQEAISATLKESYSILHIKKLKFVPLFEEYNEKVQS